MNATLEKKLAALTLQEKAEVIDYLLPAVAGADRQISANWLAELERCDASHEAQPESGITLEKLEKIY